MKNYENYKKNKQKYKDWSNHQIQFGKDVSNFSKGATLIVIILLIIAIVSYLLN